MQTANPHEEQDIDTYRNNGGVSTTDRCDWSTSYEDSSGTAWDEPQNACWKWMCARGDMDPLGLKWLSSVVSSS